MITMIVTMSLSKFIIILISMCIGTLVVCWLMFIVFCSVEIPTDEEEANEIAYYHQRKTDTNKKQ